jgi:hypothetical protein
MKANDDFLAGGFFKVQSDEQIRFWKDIWLGDKPFREVYPNLYKILRWWHGGKRPMGYTT